MSAISRTRTLITRAAFACVASSLAACGGGSDLSPGAQDVTFNLQLGPEAILEQGASASVALTVIDDDRPVSDPGNPDDGNRDEADEAQPFTAPVEIRVVPPLPPGISVDVGAAVFTPNRPGALDVRTTADAQAGRHEIVLEARIQDSSTRYYGVYRITVLGNCAPATDAIERVVAGSFHRSIALTAGGVAYLWGANLETRPSSSLVRASSQTVVPPATLDFHTAQLVEGLVPVKSAASRIGFSAFVTQELGIVRLVTRHYLSDVGAPSGRAGWAMHEVHDDIDDTPEAGFEEVVASSVDNRDEAFYVRHRDGTVWRLPAIALGGFDELPFSVQPLQRVEGVDEAEELAAGFGHQLVRRRDGSVLELGRNGQPFAVPGVAGAVDIAAGGEFSLALLADGTALAWGRNLDGELGRGAISELGAPAPVVTIDGTPLSGIVAIAAGSQHALARRSDGSVWSWGRGSERQLGTGREDVRPYAVRIAGVIADDISAAEDSSFAVTSGRVLAWGDNAHGELGDGTISPRNAPTFARGLGFGAGAGCDDQDPPPPPPPPSGWQQLGPVVSDAAATPAIAIDSRQRPVVAFVTRDSSDVSRLSVRRLVDGAWQDLGPPLNPAPALSARQPSLVIDTLDRPIVAWVQTQPDLSLVMVSRFNGTSWESLCGRNGFCDLNYSLDARAEAPSLALDANGRPAAAWVESGILSAKRFDGTAWQAFDAGPRPITAGVALRVRLAFSNDNIGYLAWTLRNAADVDMVRVARADAASWTQLAEVPRPAGSYAIPDLGLGVPPSGEPVVAWPQVESATSGATIRAAQWNGAAWVSLGDAAITTVAAFDGFAFAMTREGVPYVALSHTDGDTGTSREEHRRFLGGAWIPMALFHGQVTSLAFQVTTIGAVESPHFVWARDGGVEVWRHTP